jgi:hypothetical protein
MITPMRAPTHPKDPTELSVQIQFRTAYWYREQLIKMAREHDMNLSQFALYCIEKCVPPVKSKGLK